MFLHGFMGAGSDWLPLARRCADHFYCLLPDLPGHGHHTNLAGPLDFDNVADGLNQLCEHFRLDSLNLVGYSMGGRIALYTACKYPHKINNLILESVNPGIVEPEVRRARANADDKWAALLLSQGIDAFVEQWYALDLFKSLQAYPALLAQVKTKRQQNDARRLAQVISELSPGRQPPLWAELGRLSMPVLLLAGALDVKYAELVKVMGAKIPGATVEIIPGAGHNIHLEKSEEFIGRVMEFLQA
jgi:2-succinyl-6-hydroxy-2,4-cyclohexadiene-1-carboxylate synthase